MFIQPIVDLWTGRPTAYVLTDKDGCPVEASSPRDLYIHVDAALQRDFTPLVVCRPAVMKSAWEAFVSKIPEPLWVYEAGKVFSDCGNVVMEEDGEPCARWKRGIDDAQSLKTAMTEGIHYGSGIALTGVELLEITYSAMYHIEWGR